VRAILTLNGGSATLKVALFEASAPHQRIGEALIERLGTAPCMRLRAHGLNDLQHNWTAGEGPVDAQQAFRALWPALLARHRDLEIVAVGHRIVHGGPHHAGPCLIDETILADLQGLIALAPLHQPANLAVIIAAQQDLPRAQHVACFDTAFHAGGSFDAQTFALPRHFYDEGIRRYGFHGLSYASVLARLKRERPDLADSKIVIAHLGSGCSLCGLEGGRSKATTMGFSTLEGLPMGTRSGSIDPGVLLYLMMDRGMDAKAIEDLLYKRSGLLGLSGLSADVRDLEASDTPEAHQALDYFCRHIGISIAALAGELGGLDAVIFTAGIGENSALIRDKVCRHLAWLGAVLDPEANRAARRDLSMAGSRLKLCIIPTDEEGQIALQTAKLCRL
jgi:acetate kinase